METLFHDLRFALRLLWRDRGFTATAVTTLAVCIGANAAIFAVVNAIVLKLLRFPDSERIVRIYNSYPRAGVARGSTGVPDYFDRVRGVTALEEQALYQFQGVSIGEPGSVERIQAIGATPSFFRLVGAQTLIGRTFSEREGELGEEKKVLLSYSLWQRLFGGSTSVVGKDLRVNGVPHSIIGVMPADFTFLQPGIGLYRPLAFSAEQKSEQSRHSNNWQALGRLKPGATLRQAQAQIDAINAAIVEHSPIKQALINAGFHSEAVLLKDDVVRDIRGTLYLLWGGVLFVLLIGAVNIANLVMARSNGRLRELATRFSLGASHWRVTRQLSWLEALSRRPALRSASDGPACARISDRHSCSDCGRRMHPAGTPGHPR